jgi:hypothetical protein
MSTRPLTELSHGNYCWVFVGQAVRTRDDRGWRKSTFPSAVFSTKELAESWIATHCLSGVLTRYAIDIPAFEYSQANGTVSPIDSDGRYRQVWSGGEVHMHFTDGTRT